MLAAIYRLFSYELYRRIKTPTIRQIHQKLSLKKLNSTHMYIHTHTKINRFYIRLVTTKSTKSLSSFEHSFTKIKFLCARIFWHVFHKLTVHNQKIRVLYLVYSSNFSTRYQKFVFLQKLFSLSIDAVDKTKIVYRVKRNRVFSSYMNITSISIMKMVTERKAPWEYCRKYTSLS